MQGNFLKKIQMKQVLIHWLPAESDAIVENGPKQPLDTLDLVNDHLIHLTTI